MADGDEHGVEGDVPGLAGDRVEEGEGLDGPLPLHLGDGGVHDHVDLRVVPGALLHDRGRTEFIAAVDQGDLFTELGEEVGLLHGGVAATDDGDLLALEEEAVAGGAGGDSVAQQLLLTGDTEVARGGTGDEDDGLRVELLVLGEDLLDLTVELDAHDVLHTQVGAEALGLVAHVLHEVRAHDARREPREVLHLGGLHEQTAEVHALEDEGLEFGAGRVDGGGVAGGAGADDDDVVEGGVLLAHGVRS